MSTELIAILAVGVALATLIANGQHTLRSEMQTQRAETRAEFQAVRAETQAEFHAVRTEMQAQRKDISGLLGRMGHLEGRMAHLEGLLEGLREAITGRSVAATENPTQHEQRQPGSAIPQP